MRGSGWFTLIVLMPLLLIACAPPATLPTLQPTPLPLPTTTPVPLPTAGPDDLPEVVTDTYGTGQIRIVQAAAHASAVDVYLDDRLLGARMGPETYTDPINVQQGAYVIQAVPAQARPNTQVLAELSITVEADRAYLLVISGPPDALIFAQYQLDTDPIRSGQSRVTFLHGVPRAPDTTAKLDEHEISDTIAYGEDITAESVPAGSHTLAFESAEGTVATIEAELEAQQVYTAMLLGDVSGGNEHILMLSHRLEAPGQIRFIHAAPDAESIAIVIDGELPGEPQLDYRSATEWLMLGTGRHTLTVSLGDDEQLLEERVFTLNAGQSTEFALIAADNRLELVAYAHTTAPTPRQTAQVVAINAVDGTTSVQGFDYGDLITQITPLNFGTASRPGALEAKSYGLVWVDTTNASNTTIEEPGQLTLQEGFAYTYVITGHDSDPLLIGTRVGVDDSLPSLYATTPDTAPPQQLVEVRIINALYPPQRTEVRLGTHTTVVEPFTLSDVQSYSVGQHFLRIKTTTDDVTTHTSDAITLPDEESVLILVQGPPEKATYTILEDHTQPVQAGQSIVRFINANPAGAVLYATIDLQGYTAHLTPQPTNEHNPLLTPIFAPNQPQYLHSQYQSQVFEPGSASAFIGLPTGNFTMQVANSTDAAVVAIMPPITLQSQRRYEFLLLPDAAGSGYTVEVLTP